MNSTHSFSSHYGFLGERELVKFNEDHYYCGSAILGKHLLQMHLHITDSESMAI